MNSRQIILAILKEFEARPGNVERLTERGLGRHRLDHRDRRFVFENVYGVVRNRTRLDFLIESFLDDGRLLRNTDLMQILRLGIYQIVYLDRVPDHAAVNESVALARANASTERFAGVVNAVLRNCIRHAGRLPAPDASLELSRRLAILYSHPEWLVKKWLGQFGLASVKKLLAFNNTPPPVYLRRRLRGVSRTAFENDIRAIAEPAGGFHGLYYRLTKRLDVADIGVLKGDRAVVQAPSSGWVCALLGLEPGQWCLDLCSAPGGKASLAAELVGGEGRVIATEIQPKRFEKVVDVKRRLGLRNLLALVCDANVPPFAVAFDSVLLDAPCTATGVMHRHPDARWIRDEQSVTTLAAVQERLLRSAADLTAPGGVLVYATCSLEPEENKVQVESFLRENPTFVLEPPPSAVPQSLVTIEGYLQITPWEHGMDGMFAARMRKGR